MVWIGSVVACPVETTVVVPNRHDVLLAGCNGFGLAEYLAHEGHEVLGGVAVDCCHFVTLAHGKFLHETLDDVI